MSAWTCRPARSPERSFHLVFESHDGTAHVPIPERSTSPRVTSTLPVVDSLNALDPNRPIREADIVLGGEFMCVFLSPLPDIAAAYRIAPAQTTIGSATVILRP